MKKVLLLLFVVIGLVKANAQGQLVRGKVMDENNRPLSGATVTLKGTTVSTTTDSSGNFQISTGSQVSPVLVVSFVGYLNSDFPVRGRSELNVSLQQDPAALGDVIVVGYGTQKKSDITGASSSVKAAEIAKRPLVRLEQALQGTTAGVAVTSPNGQPGQGLRVKIRGANSITGGTEPLYVIDGNIGNGSDVNPADIESLEVLKDAASTAIYGSRASNGVVLITTRSGGVGRPKFSVNAWASKDKIPKELDLMGPYDFARSVNAQFIGQGGSAASVPFSTQQLGDFKSGAVQGTDWQRALHTEPWVQNYQVSLSGGSDNVRYYFSGGYLSQPGIILNQWARKTTFRGNVDIKVNNQLNVKFIISGIIPRNHNTNYGGGLGDPFNQAVEWDPTSPIRDANGNFIKHSSYASIQFNPIAQALSQQHDNMSGGGALTDNYSGSAIITYRLFKDLTFTSTNVYNLNYGYGQSLDGPNTGAYDQHADNALTVSARNRGFLSSNYLTYKHSFGDHTISATALYELQNGQNMSTTATARNLITYGLGYYNLGLGATQQTASSYSADALVSWLGRVYYTFKDKYTLSASIRADGSSHLTNKWSSFPSVGVNWNMKKENWLANSRVFSDLKVRASYGQTGNQAVPAYSSIPLINVGGGNNQNNYYYGGGTPGQSGSATVATSVGAPTSKFLKWEIKTTYDAGFDMAFLNGRLTLSVDGYTGKVKNLLYNIPSPQYDGGANYQTNIGSLSNKGFELAVGGTPVSGREFKWTTNLTLSINRNKVISLGGLDNLYAIGGNSTYNAMLKVGQPLGEFAGYKFLGTWKTSEAATAALYGNVPGDAKYLDINGDHIFNASDYLPLGNATPKYSFGFINDVSYHDFTLSFMFQGQQGSQVFSQTLAYLWGGLGDMKNATTVQAVPENLWTAKNQTDNPAWSSSNSNKNGSSRYVYNSSYAKLKNLSLTYRVPNVLVRRMKMSSLEIYVSGQNLWTITPYKGYDPEVDNQPTGNAISQGQEFGVIPNPKSYTFGLRLSL
ncbi:MAG TPA: TonB-dependent receptor [Puia sp.]|jgi:TonB-linked SusC/RagA family outer membrane protein